MFNPKYYKDKIEQLRQRRSNLLRNGRYAQANALNDDIRNIERMIADYEEQTRPRPLSQVLTPQQIKESDIINWIKETHLAADYLADCAFMLRETFRSLHIEVDQLTAPLNALIKQSESFAALMACTNDLTDMLVEDETLVQALRKKVRSYIKQRDTKKRKDDRNTKEDA